MSHDKGQVRWIMLTFTSPFDDTQTCNTGAGLLTDMDCRAEDGSINWLKFEHRVVTIPQYPTSVERIDVIFSQSRVTRAIGVKGNVQSGVAVQCSRISYQGFILDMPRRCEIRK
jgi:hypothetical protein